MKMTCPLCGEEIKFNLNFILVQKCNHCKKKIAEGRRAFTRLNAIGMFVSFFLVAFIQDYCNVFHMNKVVFDCLAFVIGFLFFGLVQVILLWNCGKFKRN